MYLVAKSTSINLRITQEFRNELQILADYRGLSLSSLAHSILVKGLRKERELEPEAFESERTVNGKNNGIPVAPRSRSAGIPLHHAQKKKNKRAS